MRAKHTEKRENLKNIEKLKKRIGEKGGEQLADDEFDKIMLNKGIENKNRAGHKSSGKNGVLAHVRDKLKKKSQFKAKSYGKKGSKSS